MYYRPSTLANCTLDKTVKKDLFEKEKKSQ